MSGRRIRIGFARSMPHEFLRVDRVCSFDRIHHQDSLHGSVRADGEHFFQLCLRRYGDDARAGIVEDERSLLGGLRRINRDGNRAQGKDGEVGDCPLGTIFAEDGDAIAFANPPGFQCARHSHDATINSVEEIGTSPEILAGASPVRGGFLVTSEQNVI